MADFNDFGLLVGRYHSSAQTLTDLELRELLLDSAGRLIISGRWLEDAPHASGDAGLFSLGVRDDGVAATGTVTVVDYTQLALATLTVGGTVLTEGTDWTAATDNATTATSLAAAIDALPNVSASAIGAAITILAAPGLAGNLITLATSDAVNLTISGANLSGGADDTVFTSDNYDYSPMAVDKYGRLKVTAELDVNFDYVYAEDSGHTSGDLGAYVLAVRQDTLATDTSQTGDYASFKVNAKGELYVHDVDANATLTTIEGDLDSIYTEQQDQGNTLDDIDTSLNNIETDIANLTHIEDAQHQSGDTGIMPLAVRKDTAGTLAGSDGDYAPLQVDADGYLRVTAVITPIGSEQYTVTDALAAAGDGLETITAAATPWVTVASFAHTSGTAYLFGYAWSADQNCDARIVTYDTTNTIVYKRSLNSSAMPSYQEQWTNEGRVEIVGAANLEIRLQIKKRSTTGGNCLGHGSLHIRK